MTEVVGGELRLPARAEAGLRARHDAGAGDDDVGAASGREESLGESAHALQITEIEIVHLDALDAADRLLCRRSPPGGNDHVGACADERARRFQADARVAAGDDGEFAGEIRSEQNLRRRALRPESGSDSVLRCCHDFKATN